MRARCSLQVGCVQPTLAPGDRCGDGARARPRRHLAAAASPRAAVAARCRITSTPARSARAARAPQHRCLVAARRARRRGDRRHRQRLRRDGQGLRPPAAATIPRTRRRPRAIAALATRPRRGGRRAMAERSRRGRDGPRRAEGRVPSAVHAAARNEAQGPRRGDPAGDGPRADAGAPTRICAAARRARTRCCSPRSPASSGGASSTRSTRADPTSSPPRTSAASSILRKRRQRPVRHWIELLDARMVGGVRPPAP